MFNWSKIQNENFCWWKIIIDIISIMYWSFLPNICMSISADWKIETADEKNEENKEILLVYVICSKEKKIRRRRINKTLVCIYNAHNTCLSISMSNYNELDDRKLISHDFSFYKSFVYFSIFLYLHAQFDRVTRYMLYGREGWIIGW